MILLPGEEINAANAYEVYFAVKSYFSTKGKYDYFRYNGKILRKAVKDNFRNNKELTNGIRLYNKYKSIGEIEKAVVASFIYDDVYISDISYDEYNDLRRRYDTILYVFEQDLTKVFSKNVYSKFEDYITHNDDFVYSCIYDSYANKEICPETIIILNFITKFLDRIKNEHSDFVFDEEYTRLMKYKEFFKKWIKFNILDFKHVLVKVLKNFAMINLDTTKTK